MATDAFTDTNGVQISTHDAHWQLNQATNEFDIQSNNLAADNPNANGECGARWNDTFDAAHYAQVRVAAVSGTASSVGPGVRHQAAGTFSYYGIYYDVNGSYLFKVVSGTWTQLGSNGAAPSVNDVLRVEISGTTLTPKLNGSTLSPPGAQTVSDLSNGVPGVTGWNDATANRVDDWEGGNLAGAAGHPAMRRLQGQRHRPVELGREGAAVT